MTDREKQIEEMSLSMLKWAKLNQKCCDTKGAYSLAEYLINMNYRKTDEITLKLDLGDRSAEEIQQIAEAFNQEIKKQVAKEIYAQILQVKYKFNLPKTVKIDIFDGALLDTALNEMQSDLLNQFNGIFKKYGVEID